MAGNVFAAVARVPPHIPYPSAGEGARLRGLRHYFAKAYLGDDYIIHGKRDNPVNHRKCGTG
jgi:hypothetical protein